MLINASSRMNLSYGVMLPSSPRMIPSNGVTLPSSSRMSLSNGVKLRSSSHLCKSMHDNLDDQVLPIQRLNRVRDLKPLIPKIQTINRTPNSYELKETINLVSDADFYEHFETWCKKYGKTYSPEEHKRYRFNLFKDNYPINPPNKSYLSLHFLDEYAADDHPNDNSHRLGCSMDERHYGAMYLHKIGCRQPFIVPLDSSDLGNILDDSVFFERYEIDATNLNTWKTKVTESMTILNFPRSISRRFLTHKNNPCFIKVIDRESGTHFPCLVKNSGRDVHDPC